MALKGEAALRRLEKIKEREAALAAEKKLIGAEARKAERAKETKRLILIGRAIEKYLDGKTDDKKTWFRNMMDSYLTKNADRELFNFLKPLPEAEAEPKPKGAVLNADRVEVRLTFNEKPSEEDLIILREYLTYNDRIWSGQVTQSVAESLMKIPGATAA